MKLSKRVEAMQESPVRKLVPIATRVKKQGKKVYHLNIGQPDIETPKVFMEAINNYNTDIIKYSFSQGEPVLIDAIIDYFKRSNVTYNKEDIVITNGGSEAVTFATIATCDPGDEIIVPEPFYTNYNGFTGEVNAVIKPITTFAENGFRWPDEKTIEAAINSKTRAIMFSNPGNPTGVVLTDDEMQMIARIAKKHDLYIISDEVYQGMSYDGIQSKSMSTIPGIEENLIIIESVSKRFSACGARIGAVVSKNKALMKNMMKLCQARLCVATLEQIGSAALYKLPQSYINDVRDEYENRRNIVYETVNKIDGVVCEKPQGSFYVIAKLPVENAEEFVIWLLEDFELDGETIMVAPAEGFYATKGLGKDEIRIAYMLNSKEMERAMHILDEALKVYPKRVK